MDKVHIFSYFKLQIMCNIHSYMCSTHVFESCMCMCTDVSKYRAQRKYEKILVGAIQTGGLYVYVQSDLWEQMSFQIFLYLLAN